MASDDIAKAPSTPGRSAVTSSSDFDKLFVSKIVAQNGAAQCEEVATLQATLDELQGEFIDKQVKQNVMEKLLHVEHEDDLRAMVGVQDRVHADYRKRRTELDAIVTERRLRIAKIGELVDEIEREKDNVIKREETRPEFDSELEKLKAEWKELQRRNAQRKAKIQMDTGMMLNSEDDCNRVLERQTHEIQELHEKQKRLEEKKVDLSTRVKHTTEKIAALEKQNDIRSRDLQTKRREEECATLEHMRDWYQNMHQLLTSLTGIDITQITDEFMELCLLKTHTLRLFFDPQSTKLRRVEISQSGIDASDLVEIAVRTNNVQFLAVEYLDRLTNAQAASA